MEVCNISSRLPPRQPSLTRLVTPVPPNHTPCASNVNGKARLISSSQRSNLCYLMQCRKRLQKPMPGSSSNNSKQLTHKRQMPRSQVQDLMSSGHSNESPSLGRSLLLMALH